MSKRKIIFSESFKELNKNNMSQSSKWERLGNPDQHTEIRIDHPEQVVWIENEVETIDLTFEQVAQLYFKIFPLTYNCKKD